MTPSPDQPPFLDVPALLAAPARGGQGPRGWYFVGGLLLVFMVMAYLANGQSAQAARVFLPLLATLVVGGLFVAGFVGLQKHRAQLRQLEAVEEFVQLRHWPMAASAVDALLRQPPRTAMVRVQALVLLSNILARYHRFNDAIAVQNHLLETVPMEGGADYALRLGRTMAMLREDHLFDADRAISELRRLGEGADSAGLWLIELYRDVVTGHPAEAIDLFERRVNAMRDKLGHRLGDAYALAARAYDLLERPQEAAGAWGRATALAPAIELRRRYPQISPMADKFAATMAPAGM